MTYDINDYRDKELENLTIIEKGGYEQTFRHCRIEDTDKDGRTWIADRDCGTCSRYYIEDIIEIEPVKDDFSLPF